MESVSVKSSLEGTVKAIGVKNDERIVILIRLARGEASVGAGSVSVARVVAESALALNDTQTDITVRFLDSRL